MSLTIAERNAAAHALNVGALGLGENHEEPEARSFAMELIRAGLVRRLMVELYAPTYQQQIDDADPRNPSVYIWTKFSCEIKLHDVINLARSRSIPVDCIDGRDGQAGRASAMAMRRRNQNAAREFTRITGAANGTDAEAKGTLILFGGAHFEGNDGIQRLIPGLPVCMAG